MSFSPFYKGQPVWVVEEGGSERAAEFVGQDETTSWFGGPPKAYVVYLDTHEGGEVEVDRVIPRES
jgi:hypothetical protein